MPNCNGMLLQNKKLRITVGVSFLLCVDGHRRFIEGIITWYVIIGLLNNEEKTRIPAKNSVPVWNRRGHLPWMINNAHSTVILSGYDARYSLVLTQLLWGTSHRYGQVVLWLAEVGISEMLFVELNLLYISKTSLDKPDRALCFDVCVPQYYDSLRSYGET